MASNSKLKKALHYVQIEDYEAAIKEYSLILEELPIDEHFVIFSNQGIAYLKLKKINQAIQCFQLAVEKFPDHSECLHNLGIAYICDNNYDKALQCLTKCLNKDPEFFPAICAKALILCKNEKPAEAQTVFYSVKNDNIQILDLYQLTEGIISFKMKDFEKAIDIFKQFQPQTEQIKCLYAKSLYGYAQNCYEERKYDLSIEFLRKSNQIKASSEKYFAIAVLFLKTGGSITEVTQNLEAALRINANFAEALEILGLIAAKRGDYGKAVKHLRQSVDTAPKFGRARYNLALALLRQGDYREAHRQLSVLLELEPNHQKAQSVSQLLDIHVAAHPVSEVGFKDRLSVEPLDFSKPLFSDADINIQDMFSDVKSFSSAGLFQFEAFSETEVSEQELFETEAVEEKVDVEIRIYSLVDLQNAVKLGTVSDLEGVLSIRLEESLDDVEFEKAFLMTRPQFYDLSQDEQSKLRQDLGLIC